MVKSKNGKIDFPGIVKFMNLKELSVRYNMRLWMPLIQGFSSLDIYILSMIAIVSLQSKP